MSYVQRGLRRASQPVTDRLQSRAAVLEHLIHAVKNELVHKLDQLGSQNEAQNEALHESVTDQISLQARKQAVNSADLATLISELASIRDEVGYGRTSVEGLIEAAAPSIRLRQLTGARLAEIDAPAAGFLNYAHSHRGPLADAGLWLNNPVVIEWLEGEARIGAVNERIIEHPFAFTAIGRLPPGSRILDIGGGESTFAFSLASMGHDVTVIEPQGYPFSHPNLTVFEEALESFPLGQPFDAVVLLSTIEHFGIGHYRNNPDADSTADIDAMAIVRQLTKPDGMLVLTTPYGPAEVNDLERIYDLDQLGKLIAGWTVDEVMIGRRLDDTSWTVESHKLEAPQGAGRVVMLTARPSATP